MDLSTPSTPPASSKLKRRLHPDNWYSSLRLVLLLQGRNVSRKETIARLTDASDRLEKIKQKLQKEHEMRTTRIIASATITSILGGIEGAIFIGLMFSEYGETKRLALALNCVAISILIWSLISGLQYLFLFFSDPLDRAMETTEELEYETHHLYEKVLNLNAKATVIAICQAVSGLLTMATLFSLVF